MEANGNPKIKVHIHDNSKVPAGQNCLAEHELERGKVITLHMHDGPCQLCPEGHCHHGSIGIVIGLDDSLMVVFERTPTPERITFDDFRPKNRISHEGASTKRSGQLGGPRRGRRH
jgi:hypothetical protein